MSSANHTRYTTSSSSPTPMAVYGTAPTATRFLYRNGFRSLKAGIPRPRSMNKAEDSMGRPTRTPVDSPSSPLPNVFADSDTNSSPAAHRTPLNALFLAGFDDLEVERVEEDEYALRDGPWRAPAAPVARGIQRQREESSSPCEQREAKRVRRTDAKAGAPIKPLTFGIALSPLERSLVDWIEHRETASVTQRGVALGHGGVMRTGDVQNAVKLFCALIAAKTVKQGRVGRKQQTLVAVDVTDHGAWEAFLKAYQLSALKNVENHLRIAEIDAFDVILTTPEFAGEWSALGEVTWNRVIADGTVYIGDAKHEDGLTALSTAARWALIPSTMRVHTRQWLRILDGSGILPNTNKRGRQGKKEREAEIAAILAAVVQ